MEKKTCVPALVLGIVGIVLGLFIPIIGICCGIIGLVICNKSKEEYNIKAGLILSGIALVFSIVSWIIGVIALASLMSSGDSAMVEAINGMTS